MPKIAQRIVSPTANGTQVLESHALPSQAVSTAANPGTMPASSTMPGQYMRGTFGSQTMVPGSAQRQFGNASGNFPTQYTWPAQGVSPVVQKVTLNNTPQQPQPAPPVQPGQPYEIFSVSAASEPFKTSSGNVVCAVSISFVANPSDPNFTNCRIWFVGYHGSTTPQLMAEGPTSPVSFLADPTGENVTVYAEAISNQGVTSQGPVTTYAPSDTIDLASTVGIPPTPSIAQTLTGTPTGYQFAFNQLAGLAANVIDGYAIYRNTSMTPSGSTQIQYIKQNPANSTPIVISDVAAQGQTYFYWVAAFDTSGNESNLLSAQSGTISPLSTFTPSGQVYGPATVSGIQAAQLTMAEMHDSVGLTLSSNLLQNANFVAGNVGWTPNSGSAWSIIAGSGYQGSGYLAQFGTAGGTASITNNQQTPCAFGNVVSAAAYGQSVGSNATTAAVRINFYSASGSYLGTVTGSDIHAASEWTQSRAVGVAPANTGYATVDFACFGQTAGTFQIGGFTASLLANSIDEVPNGTTYVRTSVNNVDPTTGNVTSFQGQGALATVNIAETENIAAGAVNSAVTFQSSSTILVLPGGSTVASAAPDSAGGLVIVTAYLQLNATRFDGVQIQRGGTVIGGSVESTGTPPVVQQIAIAAIDTSPDPTVEYSIWVNNGSSVDYDAYAIYLIVDHRKV